MDRDPLKELQVAAARAVACYASGQEAKRVVILGVSGELLSAPVPCSCDTNSEESNPVIAGWQATDRQALYDGQPVAVGPSRLKLLRVLVEAEAALTADELTKLVFDSHTRVENTRYHIRQLKKELKTAFRLDSESMAIVGDDEGYSL